MLVHGCESNQGPVSRGFVVKDESCLSKIKIPSCNLHEGIFYAAETYDAVAGVLRLCCASLSTMEPVSPFAIFPYHENGRGIENGRVSPTEDSHQQDEHKVTDAFSAKEYECK